MIFSDTLAGSFPFNVIIIVLVFVISLSNPGVTVSFSSKTIWFSSNMSDTFVFDVITVISWLFENFIFILLSFALPANTDIPNITKNIELIITIFLILEDLKNFFIYLFNPSLD